jgi:putative ABC transport system permease protein
MRTTDIVSSAVRNAFRSKLRTSLTVLAIFVGAFTLSLTSGLGAGINGFVDSTVASVGVDDVMTVTKTSEQEDAGSGPTEYDPNQLQAASGSALSEEAGAVALTSGDLDTISAVDGVLRVEPLKAATIDYVQHENGTRYQFELSQFVPGMQVELAAGEQVDFDVAAPQVVLPESYVEPLGLGTQQDAIGATLTLAVTDGNGKQVTAEATVVGVAEPGLVSSGGGIPNEALTTQLYDLQDTGTPAGQEPAYASASVWFDPDAAEDASTAVATRLADAGYSAATLDDQLGAITSVIDIVVLVLNGFAVIALLAAGIGIVNTLFMAVQERTREVGLMKAMGLSSGRVFALFSIEAMVIGFLGSAIGVLAAVGTGELVGAALSGGILASLPGLTLVAFEPTTVAAVILGVMALAFVAGTLPALRAARQDPISSLRYE